MTTHPYVGTSQVCEAAVFTEGVGGRCHLPAVHPVHAYVAGSEVTVVMETPVQEPPGRVYGSSADAPAEDGEAGSESWAWLPGKDFARPLVESAESESAEPQDTEETPQTAAARLLLGGQDMGWGPWPVRQFSWGNCSSAAIEPGMKLVAALSECGEPFLAEVWWRTPTSRVFRVQWGALLLSSAEDLLVAVESWPSAE